MLIPKYYCKCITVNKKWLTTNQKKCKMEYESEERVMVDWIKKPDTVYVTSYIVHEVKCPVCKVSETFIGHNIPKRCYVCGEERSVRGS